MPQIKSWTVRMRFWAKVEPLIHVSQRSRIALIFANLRRRKPMPAAFRFFRCVYVWDAVASEGSFTRLGSPVLYICIFRSGSGQASSSSLASRTGRVMTRWKPSHGTGRVSTERCDKSATSTECVGPQPHGSGKKWRQAKPLSGIGLRYRSSPGGANTHDVKCWRPRGPACGSRCQAGRAVQSLCRCGATRVRQRPTQSLSGTTTHHQAKTRRGHEKRIKPGFKARRWVVERTHSWINRFRKLLSASRQRPAMSPFLSLACAMICWRQTITIHG